MIKSKFIQLLKSLSDKELKEFRFFLKGLYSRQEKALSLFEYILKYAPAYDSNKLDKAYVLRKKFPETPGNTKRISNELHKLFDWLEQFLLMKKLQAKDSALIKAKLLRDIYKERQLHSLYDRKVEAIGKIARGLPDDSWHHFHLLELYHDQYYYSPTEKMKKGKQEIYRVLENLEELYQTKKLKYQCEILSRKNILGQSENGQHQSAEKNALIPLYSKLQQLIVEKTPDSYRRLKEELLRSNDLAQEEQLILLSYLINYTSSWILAGDRQGFVEAFELYQHGIEQGIIIENGLISEGKFHNITNIACELGEYAWARKFVREYRQFLLSEIRDSAQALAEARIAFGEKKYEKTLDLLMDVQYKNIAYVLQAKLLQVRSYFELGSPYASSLNYFVQSFDVFLTRNKKVNRGMLTGYRNFLMMLKMLNQHTLSKEQLEGHLSRQSAIVCKSWIKQKIRNYQPARQ